MLEFVEWSIFPFAFAFPAILAICNFVLFRKNENRNRIIVLTALSCVLGFAGAILMGISLIFRDGMAAGMISSEGSEALHRSSPGIFIGMGIVLCSLFITPGFRDKDHVKVKE